MICSSFFRPGQYSLNFLASAYQSGLRAFNGTVGATQKTKNKHGLAFKVQKTGNFKNIWSNAQSGSFVELLGSRWKRIIISRTAVHLWRIMQTMKLGWTQIERPTWDLHETVHKGLAWYHDILLNPCSIVSVSRFVLPSPWTITLSGWCDQLPKAQFSKLKVWDALLSRQSMRVRSGWLASFNNDHVRRENLPLQAQVHYGHENKPGAARYLKEAGSSSVVTS